MSIAAVYRKGVDTLQEEVTQKTIALSVNVGKGAARLTEPGVAKSPIKKFLEQKSKAPAWETDPCGSL